MTVAAIIMAAGSGSRAGDGIPKQFRLLRGKPMLRHSVEAFARHPGIDRIVIVIGPDQQVEAEAALTGLENLHFVDGGVTRRDSVNNGLQDIEFQTNFVLIHDAARPFLSASVIDDLIDALDSHDGAVPALPVTDSLARSGDGSVLSASENREGLWRIQTPQAFRMEAIIAAHRQWDASNEATDDARMAIAAGYDVALVPGDEALAKYTFARDFQDHEGQLMTMPAYRTGSGYDVHRLATGEELWLCGLKN